MPRPNITKPITSRQPISHLLETEGRGTAESVCRRVPRVTSIAALLKTINDVAEPAIAREIMERLATHHKIGTVVVIPRSRKQHDALLRIRTKWPDPKSPAVDQIEALKAVAPQEVLDALHITP